MKIAALSDIMFTKNSTKEYRRIVKRYRPDVVVMAGDYDESFYGTAFFHSKEEYKMAEEHKLDYFYEFLKYCGKRSQGLVIRGNHEIWDASYSSEKINSIFGCQEISNSEVVEINWVSFLGIGYFGLGYPKKLLPIVKRFTHASVDVIATHCDSARLKVLTRLEPQLIIRGHAQSGPSKYSVNRTPVVSTGVLRYAIILFSDKRLKSVLIQKRPQARVYIPDAEFKAFQKEIHYSF